MGFFTISREYNRLAKSFNGMYVMIQQIEFVKIEPEIEDVYLLAYITREEVFNRIEKFNWGLSKVIFVPMIPGKRTTIEIALNLTVRKVSEWAIMLGIEHEIDEIMSGGPLFHEFKLQLPVESRQLFK